MNQKDMVSLKIEVPKGYRLYICPNNHLSMAYEPVRITSVEIICGCGCIKWEIKETEAERYGFLEN